MLEFKTVLKSLPVKIEDEEYQIIELSGIEQEAITDQMSGRMEYDADGKPIGMTSYKGVRTALIALCLRDKENTLVSADTIQGWPASTIQGLFDAASELSGLNKKAEEKAKNE